MSDIFLCSFLILVTFFIFKKILRKKISPYNSKFWSVVEIGWLIVSFTGISIGIYELTIVKSQLSYAEGEDKIQLQYNNIRLGIHSQTIYFPIDSTTSENEKESIQWFHKIQLLLEDGYKGNQWRKFIYYTEPYIFNDKYYLNNFQGNAIMFGWPQNINLNPKNIIYKEEIRHIIDDLVILENMIDDFQKAKPDNSPLFFTRYIFIYFFSFALAFKLLKAYADYLK